MFSASIVPYKRIMFTSGVRGSFPPPPYGLNRARHAICPPTKKWVPCRGLFGAHRQRQSRPRICLIRAYFCQGQHRETFSASNSATHPLCTAACHPIKKQLKMHFLHRPEPRNKIGDELHSAIYLIKKAARARPLN